MPHSLKTIGIIHSCFREKFLIPRQPGLVQEATGSLEILSPYDRDEAFSGLADFSHIWISFIFHATAEQGWKPMVRPPRLGGNQRMGVFATRSTFRPNPLGLSVVELTGIERRGGKLLLQLKGLDLLDGTPVVDIKPYLPYVDALPEAHGGFAPEQPEALLAVRFSPQAEQAIQAADADGSRHLKILITHLLELDPRPAYYRDGKGKRKAFAVRLLEFELHWEHEENGDAYVTDLEFAE